ncbi:MAG: sigma-70 family RNA polymerase sigma factor [Planctomycetes bacterium]|nr:sigma-70 family RNA polymerase sigma factor [Planctomycetota bacterium]
MLQSTSTELLNGLRDPRNHAAWLEFCARYGPVLLAFARRLGLGEADAQDATQETFIAFARAYQEGRYSRERGRLRSWLFGVIQNKVRDIQRRRARDPAGMSVAQERQLNQRAADGAAAQVWEEEWRQAVIRTCLDLVRRDVAATTLAAFEAITLQEHAPEAVAKNLGMSKAAVVKANQRVLSRMRELHRMVDVEW